MSTDPYPYDPAWVLPARFVPAGLDYHVAFEHRRDSGATRDLSVPGHIEVTIAGPAGLVAPGLALVILVVGANLVADGLREVADPLVRRAS